MFPPQSTLHYSPHGHGMAQPATSYAHTHHSSPAPVQGYPSSPSRRGTYPSSNVFGGNASGAAGDISKAASSMWQKVGGTKGVTQWIADHQSSIKIWSVFVVTGYVLYHYFSDGDFSFLLTLSSMVSMFSFLMVLIKIEITKSAKGVSVQMFKLYVALIFSRLLSIIPFEGYLPFDRSGDFLYQSVEVVTLCVAALIVVQCARRYNTTPAIPSMANPMNVGGLENCGVPGYSIPTENSWKSVFSLSTGNDSDTFHIAYVLVPCFILAFIFHPSLNSFLPADIAWTFALYVEALASLPQLFLFQKDKKVRPFTVHFLAGQALSRVLCFIFWLSSHNELNDNSDMTKAYVGYWVIGMQILQLLVQGDFIYHYVRCITTGNSLSGFILEDI